MLLRAVYWRAASSTAYFESADQHNAAKVLVDELGGAHQEDRHRQDYSVERVSGRMAYGLSRGFSASNPIPRKLPGRVSRITSFNESADLHEYKVGLFDEDLMADVVQTDDRCIGQV